MSISKGRLIPAVPGAGRLRQNSVPIPEKPQGKGGKAQVLPPGSGHREDLAQAGRGMGSRPRSYSAPSASVRGGSASNGTLQARGVPVYVKAEVDFLLRSIIAFGKNRQAVEDRPSSHAVAGVFKAGGAGRTRISPADADRARVEMLCERWGSSHKQLRQTTSDEAQKQELLASVYQKALLGQPAGSTTRLGKQDIAMALSEALELHLPEMDARALDAKGIKSQRS